MRLLALVLLLSAAASAQKATSLTAAEQVEQATGYIAKMRDMQNRVGRLAEDARHRKDIVQLSCVNDKLQQLRGHLAVAEGSVGRLKQPAVLADVAARNHEYAKVTLTHQKALVLAQEAETCVGEALRYVGPTKLEVTIDPGVPEGDPTTPAPEGIDVEERTELDRPCGNTVCDGDENVISCPDDCYCGNGSCDPGETSESCPEDCPLASPF